ncbi:zinc ribbon domain-containing protein [Demequina lutea]|uniref:Recombinase zinc beta ribbon domain-containing protein n=1 Tax=Demequina lutea TaxID=431489 RepID=A0A7Y9ZAD4_9MICO|nr:zinc ribbon domain-containing protein [Demequina lutea]NYI41712.1 hypothetical protein [Demequina lutea]
MKGILYCATCKSRLHLDFARNKQGIRYAHYVCSGQTSKRTTCTRKAVPVGIAEELVAACYERIGISEQTFTALARQVNAAFAERMASCAQELAELTDIDRKLESDHEQDTGQRKHLASALKLLTYCAAPYQQSDDEAKRLTDQAFFEKIHIGEDEQAVVGRAASREPRARLGRVEGAAGAQKRAALPGGP